MPRNARLVDPGLPFHVTQRGNRHVDVFLTPEDRTVYLDLMRHQLADAEVSILAFCLMTNHVHWLVVPNRPDSLAVLFRRVHGRYAQYFNARCGFDGHLWQGRFYSCVVSPDALTTAILYVEFNPVRAGIVDRPDYYTWSSAAEHLTGCFADNSLLDQGFYQRCGGTETWAELINSASPNEAEEHQFRRCTYAGRPFGNETFLSDVEHRFDRKWKRWPYQKSSPAALPKRPPAAAVLARGDLRAQSN